MDFLLLSCSVTDEASGKWLKPPSLRRVMGKGGSSEVLSLGLQRVMNRTGPFSGGVAKWFLLARSRGQFAHRKTVSGFSEASLVFLVAEAYPNSLQ